MAAAGLFLLLAWKEGACLVNALRIASLVVSVLSGVYALGLDDAPSGLSVRDLPGETEEDEDAMALLNDGNVNRPGGSLGSLARYRNDE